MSHWKINNNVLCIEDGGNKISPSAINIFHAEFKNLTKIDNITVTKPSIDLPQIKFSKFPFDIKINLSVLDNSVEIKLAIYFGKNEHNISLPNLAFEYVIINNTWLPFISGKNEEIETALKSIGIYSSKITIKQALELKKIANSADFLVEDEIRKEELHLNETKKSPFFSATLYDYQLRGFGWMNFMTNQGLGVVLGDEMGLGKTIQVIRLICQRIEEEAGPILIVAPSSLLENWKREFEKFTTAISILIHRGGNRTGYPKHLQAFNVVITSYDLLNIDFSLFNMIEWDMVIADEAQTIKNPSAQRTISVKSIKKKISIAITGTPFENKINDVWCIVDFIFPGYLGSLSSFEKKYSSDLASAQYLEPFVSPLILRRKISEVAQDLPERINIDQPIGLDERLYDEYDNIRLSALNNFSGAQALANIIKLRMFCCDPRLVGSSMCKDYRNYKLERLLEIVEEVFVQKEKMLVFTSFQKMADILKEKISKRYNFYCEIIDGRTVIENRQKMIDEFGTYSGSSVLILNPKAAGTGLNITAANHVVHFNNEWNPATEDQASARAYRRGQDKPVRIYKLFYANTIEELIEQRLNLKRELSEAAIVGVKGNQIDIQEMVRALNCSPKNFKNAN